MTTRARPRLLPVLIAAGAGLLTLKLIGLATTGGYILAPPHAVGDGRPVGYGLTSVRTNPDYAGGSDTTGSTPPKKDDKDKKDSKLDDKARKEAEPVPQPLPPPLPSAAEREILENLSVRRKQLEERQKQLDRREEMLKSAEKLVQERLDELKASEQRTEGDTRVKGKPGDPQMQALVIMYEAMKPRDAAKVFEKLNATQLMPLARQMNPRKLSEILAQMSPDSAEKLTLLLMRPAGQPGTSPAVGAVARPQLEELPRLPIKKTP